jgi:hypothetical protein
MEARIDLVKVFSANKAGERKALGDRVTTWIRANGMLRVTRAIVAQSSDRTFHCLTIVLCCETERA